MASFRFRLHDAQGCFAGFRDLMTARKVAIELSRAEKRQVTLIEQPRGQPAEWLETWREGKELK